MDLPVRHIYLRDDLEWIAQWRGLEKADDGTLSLVRVPAPDIGSVVLRDGPFDALPSGIAAYGEGQIFVADTSGRRVLLEQHQCAAHFAMPIDGVPVGAAIGGDTLYVADSANAKVWCFSAHELELRGVIETGLQQPVSVAVDSLERVYVLDAGLRRVLRFGKDRLADPSFSPQLDQPFCLALGVNDELYVSDTAANAVHIFDASGARVGSLAMPAQTLAPRPRALAIHGNLLLVADAASGALLVFDAAKRALVGELPDFQAPVAAMAFDAAGNLFLKLDGGADYLRFALNAGCIGAGRLEAGPFDAGEINDWERIALAARAAEAEGILLTFAASDQAAAPGVWTPSPSLDCLLAHKPGKADALRGNRRFLWLRIEMRSADGRTSPVLEQARAQTVGPTYLDELPRFFARDDQNTRFLERWLALFRSGFEDRERLLEEASFDFDPVMTRADRLSRLAEALAFELPRWLTPTQTRALLAQVPRLYAERGTLAGIQSMVEIYSGIRPRIIEAFHARRVWQLGTTSLLGFDTALAATTPEGFVVPRDARTDPAYAGLRGDYYAGTDFNELLLSRTDKTLDFPALSVNDRSGRRTQPCTVRWSGQIKPRYSESYLLHLEGGQGARLWIDGQLLIDRWRQNAPVLPDPRTPLDATRWHAIQIEVLSLSETGAARLSWSSRHQPVEIVPTDCLYSALDEHADPSAPPAATFDVGHAVVGESAPLAASEFGTGLFGDYAHLFTVLAPAGSCREAAQREALRQVIDAEKPAHTDYHLCFVEPRMRVGFQARLGIDAIVANGPPPLRLDDTRLDRDSFLQDAEPGGARVAARARLGQDTVVG